MSEVKPLIPELTLEQLYKAKTSNDPVVRYLYAMMIDYQAKYAGAEASRKLLHGKCRKINETLGWLSRRVAELERSLVNYRLRAEFLKNAGKGSKSRYKRFALEITKKNEQLEAKNDELYKRLIDTVERKNYDGIFNEFLKLREQLKTLEQTSKCRPEIMLFAQVMEAKMQIRRKRYPEGYKDCSIQYLQDKLYEEFDELLMALKHGTKTEILFELADIANICVMLADNTEALKEVEKEGFLKL